MPQERKPKTIQSRNSTDKVLRPKPEKMPAQKDKGLSFREPGGPDYTSN